MPNKKHRRRCLRFVNDFKTLLREERLFFQLRQAYENGHWAVSCFCDIDKSLQYLKRRIRRSSRVNGLSDPLLLHIYHLEYVVLLLSFSTESILNLIASLPFSCMTLYRLQTLISNDCIFLHSIVKTTRECFQSMWNDCKKLILSFLVNHTDHTSFMQHCLYVYSIQILCCGHDVIPANHNIFQSLRKREESGEMQIKHDRLSPTQWVVETGRHGKYFMHQHYSWF